MITGIKRTAGTSRLKVMQLGSPTGLYGAERWILALIRHLDPAVVESVVAAIKDAPELEAPLCSQARVYGFRSHVFEAYGRANWAAVTQLRRYILEEDIQILHTHGYKSDLIGLLATRGTACRLITTPHGWSVQAGLMLRLYEGLDRAIFRFFDAVVPLSDALHDDLKVLKGLGRKLHLIRNGVDIAEIDAVTRTAAEMTAWRGEQGFVIGYIGQLIARKGLTKLLEAFSTLDIPGKRLAIVGEGDQRPELEAMASRLGLGDTVRFFGFRADRLALLKGFDVFALPSRLEGIPRCLMEAMAAGVPVVATDIPGCRDLITHEQTGLLFPCDDAQQLRQCLERCVNASVRAALAQRGREHVVEHYSAASMARHYQALYARMLTDKDSQAALRA